jgi:hypothetical protein
MAHETNCLLVAPVEVLAEAQSSHLGIAAPHGLLLLRPQLQPSGSQLNGAGGAQELDKRYQKSPKKIWEKPDRRRNISWFPRLYKPNLFTTTTPRAVVVNAIAASRSPMSLNFSAIEIFTSYFFRKDILHL